MALDAKPCTCGVQALLLVVAVDVLSGQLQPSVCGCVGIRTNIGGAMFTLVGYLDCASAVASAGGCGLAVRLHVGAGQDPCQQHATLARSAEMYCLEALHAVHHL